MQKNNIYIYISTSRTFICCKNASVNKNIHAHAQENFIVMFLQFSTLPESLDLPDGDNLPHCMEDKVFASDVVGLWGNDIDIAAPPLHFADIKAFAYTSDVATTPAPTSTAAQPRTPPTACRPRTPDSKPAATSFQSGHAFSGLFSMEAAKVAFEIRKRLDPSYSSSASSEAEPSPPRTGESKPSPSQPTTDDTSTETSSHPRQASTSSANSKSPCNGSQEVELGDLPQELKTSVEQPHRANGGESPDDIAGRIGQPPSSAPTTRDSREQCLQQEQRDPSMKDTPVIGSEGHIEVDKVNKMVPDLHALSGIQSLLCIADPWCRMLASGRKTWELRSVPTSKRNLVEY